MRNKLRKTLSLSFVIAFALADAKFAHAQSNWHVFSPPDKSFAVELPAKPQRPINKEESAESIFENIKSAYVYSLSLRSNDPVPDFSFGVLHLSKPLSNRKFDETVNSNMLWIGGDDKHFLKEANVVVSGLHGREFIYEKGIASGRALFINGGSRIYLILFHTEVEGDISSEEVLRIFRTFKPTRRIMHRTKRLTTHSTGAESARLSSARIEGFIQCFPPG